MFFSWVWGRVHAFIIVNESMYCLIDSFVTDISLIVMYMVFMMMFVSLFNKSWFTNILPGWIFKTIYRVSNLWSSPWLWKNTSIFRGKLMNTFINSLISNISCLVMMFVVMFIVMLMSFLGKRWWFIWVWPIRSICSRIWMSIGWMPSVFCSIFISIHKSVQGWHVVCWKLIYPWIIVFLGNRILLCDGLFNLFSELGKTSLYLCWCSRSICRSISLCFGNWAILILDLLWLNYRDLLNFFFYWDWW